MNAPNRAQRRQAERAGMPPGLARDLSQLGQGMPGAGEMPTLGEQRRSAALQLAIQTGIQYSDADGLVDAAEIIEDYLVNGPADGAPADADTEAPSAEVLTD